MSILEWILYPLIILICIGTFIYLTFFHKKKKGDDEE